MADQHVFQVFFGGETEWYVAETEEEVVEMLKEGYGEDYNEEVEEITQMSDDKTLKILNDDYDEKDKRTYDEQTCAEWAKGSKGLLCSTCY